MLAGLEVALAAGGGIALGFGLARLGRRDAPGPPFEPAAERTIEPPDSRFDQLLRSLTVGIITIDRGGRLESLNTAAATIFEFGARPVLGRALIEVVPSFELDRRVHQALEGHPSRGRISLTGASEPRVLTVTTLPLDGTDGALLIASDETRLHALEQTRRDFISSVSHELRTPLSSISLMIETILEDEKDAEALRLFLPRIKQEVERMVQLVEDLLVLARSEFGHLQLRREGVDLSTVAATILETFEPRAAMLAVALRFAGEPAFIDGDPDRLAQVLVNLIDNALRHTPAGGTVAVSVRRNDATTTLVVRDTGVGIPFNDLPHIFERFYVVDRSRAREAGGTGLGLSIVKQIVEAHGGTIRAESEFGRGATFTCAFPASRSHASG